MLITLVAVWPPLNWAVAMETSTDTFAKRKVCDRFHEPDRSLEIVVSPLAFAGTQPCGARRAQRLRFCQRTVRILFGYLVGIQLGILG